MTILRRVARPTTTTCLSIVLAACGTGSVHHTPVTRDSAGVALITMGVPDTMRFRETIDTSAPLLTIGGSTDSTDGLGRGEPRSVAQLRGGRIAAEVDDSYHVRVFGRDGHVVAQIGRDGEGPGEFPPRHRPQLFSYRDSLIASDETGGFARLSVFDSALHFRRQYLVGVHDASVQEPDAPEAIGALSSGRLVYRYSWTPDSTGRSHLELAVAPGDAGDAGDAKVVVGPFDGDERIELPSAGFVHNTYVIFGKTGAAAVSGDQLFTGSNDGFIVNEYDQSGHVVRRLTIAMKSRAVTRAMRHTYLRDEFSGDTTAETRRFPSLLDGTEHFARTFRFYDKLFGTRDGGLWIERARTSDNDEYHYWIFDRDLRFTGATSLPASLHLKSVWGDTVVVTGEDANGSPYVRLFALGR